MQAYYEKILLKKNNQAFVESCYLLKRVVGWGGGDGMTQGNVYLSAVVSLEYYSIWK